MGILNKSQININENYYKEIESDLNLKDGNIHIILVHTSISNGKKPEIVYTTKINSIIRCMQKNGYEILNINLVIGGTQGLSYETLITYK